MHGVSRSYPRRFVLIKVPVPGLVPSALSEHHRGDVAQQCGMRGGRRRCARVRSAGSVSRTLLMRAQAGQLRVCALADGALVRALAGVQTHVVTQRGGLAEAAAAEAAHEGLVQRMDAHVRAQVAPGVEAAVADDAAHAARGRRGGERGRRGVACVRVVCGGGQENIYLHVYLSED